MIAVHCPRHGQDVLLGHRQILGIDRHGDGTTVRWACWCGERGSSHMARRPAPTAA
jgi:hypothetical protein